MNMVHAHASAILVCDRLVAAAALVVQRGMVVPDGSGPDGSRANKPSRR
jgi:hypothetical protein